jgi:hypothetical protein
MNLMDYENKEAMVSIASNFIGVPPNFNVLLRYYSIHGGRIILAHDDSKLVGFYTYTFGGVYFRTLQTMQYLINVLNVNDIDKHNVTIPLFTMVDRNYPIEVYYEMNKLRVADAKSLGYTCGIINTYMDATESNDFCKMREWSQRASFFENLTNTKIVNTGYLNEYGDPILIQYY